MNRVTCTASRDAGWGRSRDSDDSCEPRKRRGEQQGRTRGAVCEQRVQTGASYTDRGGRVKETYVDFSQVGVRMLRDVENGGFLSVGATQIDCV